MCDRPRFRSNQSFLLETRRMCESFAAMAAKPLTCAVIDRHRFRVVPARVLSTAFQSCNRMCLSGTRMWWLRGDGCVATHMCLDRSESKSVRDCCESRNPRNSEELSLDIGDIPERRAPYLLHADRRVTPRNSGVVDSREGMGNLGIPDLEPH